MNEKDKIVEQRQNNSTQTQTTPPNQNYRQDIVMEAESVDDSNLYSAKDKVDELEKLDWFYTRLDNPSESVKNLAITFGNKSFDQLKSSDDYWDDPNVKGKFEKMYGEFGAKAKFEKFYNIASQDFSQYQLGKYRRSQTATELYIKDTDRLKTEITRRFENLPGTYATGKDFSEAQFSFRERLNRVRESFVDANGNITFKYYDYSPDTYHTLMGDDSVSGLAYGDIWANHGGNDGVYGAYMDVIKDGKIYNDNLGKMVDVRNDQIVKRLDIDTGSPFDGWLSNNKLQADSLGDLVGTIVRSPINLLSSLVDTGIQALRVSGALSYGAVNLFKSEDLDIQENEFYKKLTNAGIYVKSFSGSNSDYAMRNGIFGSFEMAMSSLFDLAAQIGAARLIGNATAFTTRKLLAGSMSQGALRKIEQQAANRVVRATLTAFAAKDSYNSAKGIGFTDTEAAIYSVATFAALWQATRFAGYITGEYDIRVTRNRIKDIITRELDDNVAPAFRKLNQELANASTEEAKKLIETKGKMALSTMTRKIGGFVSSMAKNLPNSKMAFESQQEALEEMSEELAQDIINHAASAYGKVMYDAKKAGEGRFQTIFDDGYFQQAVQRYASSGLMGGLAGPMGMMFSTNIHNEITDTSNVIDIIASGRESELVDILGDMRDSGELGPTDLSLTYNDKLKTFEPILKGQKIESLGDMTYNSYMHDINIIKTFISTGMNGKALKRIQEDKLFSDQLNSTSMRKDFIRSATDLLALHQRTGLSTSVETELDGLTEAELETRIPEIAAKRSKEIDARRAEIEELKKRISKTTPEKEGGGKKNPGTLKPEIVKQRYGKEEDVDKLARLNKEIETLKTVTNEDVEELFSLYRKIRSIAQGTSAEHYLLQHELFDDKVFGNIETRDAEWTDLGDTPFIDLMHKATLRSLDDENEALRKGRVSADVTKKIRTITEFTPENIQKLALLFAKNPEFITKEALEHISKKYNAKKHLGPLLKAFNISTPGSLLTDDKGNYDSDKARVLMFAIAKLGSDQRSLNKPELMLNSAFVADSEIKKLFNEFKVDPEGFKLFNVDSYGLSNHPGKLMDNIKRVKHDGFQKILSDVDNSVFTLRKLGNDAALKLKSKQYYAPNDFERGNVNVLFRTIRKEAFTSKTVLDDGLGEVIDLISNPRSTGKDGITRYSKKSYAKIDDVLKDIVLREKMTEVLTKFINKGKLLQYAPMLKQFRKNVIDIIDQKYDVDENPDTTKERHAYKDYTAFSDFFTDFIFNPIEFDVINGLGDPKYLTDSDKKALKKFELASLELQPSRVIKDSEGNTTHIPIEIDYDQLEIELLRKFNNLDSISDFEEALNMMNDPYLQVSPGSIKTNVNGPVLVAMGNMFRLKASEFLLKKAKYYIQQTSGHSAELPYIEDKNEHIKKEFRSFNNVLTGEAVHEDDAGDKKHLEDFREYVGREIPEYADISINFLNNKIDYVKLGKFNIKLENLFYKIFNENIPELNKGDVSQKAIKNAISNIVNDGPSAVGESFGKTNTPAGYSNVILLGAITTDFTDFYSIYKGKLEVATDNDKAAIAAQEVSAKYSSAFVYSKKLRDYLSNSRTDKEYRNMVFIGGAAGTGKSTAVIDLGLDIATEIVKRQNEKNKTAVAGVSNHDIQIKILERTIDEKAQGIPGKSFKDFFELTRKAVIDGDVNAKAELDKIGIIVIDEVTYVVANKSDAENNDPTLEELSDMLKEYNRDRATSELVAVTMGDQYQSSAVTKENARPIGIKGNNVFALPYMSFSMRARNSYMVEGLKMISDIKKTIPGPFENGDSDYFTITGKTKYGTLDGRHFGMNIMKADEDGNAAFMNVLKDKTVLDDIEKNIKKSIDDGYDFEVIISPESIEDFNTSIDENKRLKDLIATYPDNIVIIKAAEIGGSEADYVIAEVPRFGGDIGYNRTISMYTQFNTIATRAKDFTILVVKDDTIVLPGEFNSERINNGVIIPDTSIDLEDKRSYIKHQLSILEDIDGTESTTTEDEEEEDDDDSTLKEDMMAISDTLFNRDNSFLSEDYLLDIYNDLNTNDTKPEIQDQKAIKDFLDRAYSASAAYTGVTNELDQLLNALDFIAQRSDIPKNIADEAKVLYEHIVNVLSSDFDGKDEVMDDLKDYIGDLVDIIDDHSSVVKESKFRDSFNAIFKSSLPHTFNSNNIESIFNSFNTKDKGVKDPSHKDNEKQASVRSFIEAANNLVADKSDSNVILDRFKRAYKKALSKFPGSTNKQNKDIKEIYSQIISLKLSDDFNGKEEVLADVESDLNNLMDVIKPVVKSGGGSTLTKSVGNDVFRDTLVKMITAYKGNKYILNVLKDIVNDFDSTTKNPFKSDVLNDIFNDAIAEDGATIESVKKDFLAEIAKVDKMDFSAIVVPTKKTLSKKDKKYRKLVKGINKIDTVEELSEIDQAITGKKEDFTPDTLNALYDELSDIYKINELKKEVRAAIKERIKKLNPKGDGGTKKKKGRKKKPGKPIKNILTKQSIEIDTYRLLIGGIDNLDIINGIIYDINGLTNKQSTDDRFNHVNIPADIRDLLRTKVAELQRKNYLISHIINVLGEIAKERKYILKPKTPIADAKKEAAALSNDLGLGVYANDFESMYHLLVYRHLDLLNDNTIDPNDDKFKKINRLYELLHDTLLSKETNPTFFNRFSRVTPSDEASLQKYIEEAEKEVVRNEVFTVESRHEGFPFVDKALSDMGYKNLSGEDRYKAFGLMGGDFKFTPRNLEIIFVKKQAGRMEAYIAVEIKKQKYIISQVFTKNITTTDKNGKIITIKNVPGELLLSKGKKLFENNKSVLDVSGVLDNGNKINHQIVIFKPKKRIAIEELIHVRPGKIVKTTNNGINTVNQLKAADENLSISNNVYIINNPSFGQELKNQQAFFLYTKAKDIELDSTNVIRQINEGTLGKNKYIKIKHEGLTISVGLLPVNNNISFSKMGEYIKDNPKYKIPEFSNRFSILLTVAIYDKIKNLNGNTFKDIKTAYKNYNGGQIKVARSTLDRVKKEGSAKNVLDELVALHIKNMNSKDIDVMDHILKKKKGNAKKDTEDTMVLNLQKIFLIPNPQVDKVLDVLAKYANYKFKIPYAKAGNKLDLYKQADIGFTSFFLNNFTLNIESIERGEFVLSGSILKYISGGTKIVRKNTPIYDKESPNVIKYIGVIRGKNHDVDALMANVEANKEVKGKEVFKVEVDKTLSELESAYEEIQNSNFNEKNVNKKDIDALIKTIDEFKKLSIDLDNLETFDDDDILDTISSEYNQDFLNVVMEALNNQGNTKYNNKEILNVFKNEEMSKMNVNFDSNFSDVFIAEVDSIAGKGAGEELKGIVKALENDGNFDNCGGFPF